MGFVIGLLTVILVLDCAVLTLLVLIQLPKKDAGAGLAFGGAASDALFGAGSGNMLTKITKYAAGIFFVLAIGLGILQGAASKRTASDLQRDIDQANKEAAATVTTPAVETMPAPATSPAATSAAPAAAPALSNVISVPVPTPAPAPTNSASQ